jgi:hypothetical protein
MKSVVDSVTEIEYWMGSEPEVGIVTTKSPLNSVPPRQAKVYQNVVPGFPAITPLKETVVGQ